MTDYFVTIKNRSNLPILKKSISDTALRCFVVHCNAAISQMLRARDITSLNWCPCSCSLGRKRQLKTETSCIIIFVKCSTIMSKVVEESKISILNQILIAIVKIILLRAASKIIAIKNSSQNNYNSQTKYKFYNYCKNCGHNLNECRKRQYCQNFSQNPRVNSSNCKIPNVTNAPKFK